MKPRRCCSPSRPTDVGGLAAVRAAASTGTRPPLEATDDSVLVAGGEFRIGSEDSHAYYGDGEGPIRSVELDSFRLDASVVTNRRYSEFVEDTKYATDAERLGDSFVFFAHLGPAALDTPTVAAAPWWHLVPGASWRCPAGPGSSIEGLEDHPVVHVSWNDAAAYCEWAGGRLPTEAQWEVAARGGLEGAVYPWGNELQPNDVHLMNVWQGPFPHGNTEEDGHLGTAPVRTYPANGYGLYEMTGNVWEWTADWWSPEPARHVDGPNPTGPESGILRVQKGGSYLCHASYCLRYRCAARQGAEPVSSAGNLGFRCARPA